MPDPGVPKFSSFKAKPAPVVEDPQRPANQLVRTDSGNNDRPPDRSSRHSDRPRDRDRDRHSKHRSEHRHKHRTRTPPRNETALVRLEKKPDVEQAGPGTDLFILDRRGDRLISRYHANDRAKVPLYRRGGRGRVLGSSGFLVLHREGNLDEFSIRLPGAGSSALRDRHLFNASIRRMKPRRIKLLQVDDNASASEEDFVPLSLKAKREASDEKPGLSEDEGPNYRSIEGKAKVHEYSDSELEYSSSEETTGIDLDDPMKKKSIELNRRVKEHPDDIGSWLDLIKHQDVLLWAASGVDGDATDAEVRSYAEIKLSMYESALQHAKTPEQEEQLLLGMLLEGAKVWAATKLERRWDDALEKHGESFPLWKARLDLRLSSMKAFQYQDVRDVLLDRLRKTSSRTTYPSSPHAGAVSTNNPAALYGQLIYTFLRMTRFIFDVGFRELAVSAWQALLEVNLFRPQSLAEGKDSSVLESFRDFWESEVPRIGEDGALGWANYAQADGDVDPPEPRTEDNAIFTSRDVYKSWGATERLRSLACRRPARAMDEGNDDDPYRVIIFSDLEKLLFLIPMDVTPLVEASLVDAFLLFCDLPLVFGSSEWMRAAAGDTHIIARSLNLEHDASNRHADLDPMEDQSKRQPNLSHDASQLAASPEVMFPKDWYQYFTGWAARDKDDEGPIELSAALGVLRQLNTKIPEEKLAEYRLALEWLAEPDLIKKRAKSLLRQFPSSRRLYTAYALAQWASGNADAARQVLVAASAIPESAPIRSADTLLLWTSRAWMELEVGDKTRAVLCLCATVDPLFGADLDIAMPSPPQLISTRQTLSSSLGYSFSDSRLEAAGLSAVALALFEYLTLPGGSESASVSQGNLSAAMDRVWAASSEMCARGAGRTSFHEALLQAAAKLLHFHANRGSVFLREQLARCVRLFPRNIMFLDLFAWASTSFGIEDPVRDILRDVSLSGENDCIGNRIFAIRYELQRGNTHSARAAFERALETPGCSSSASLWRAYIRFCYSRKELRGKAKEVFFRGIAACPGSKDLAMEAFTTLVNVMDEYELQSMYNTMASKGLRIHVDLDEFVSERKKDKRKLGGR